MISNDTQVESFDSGKHCGVCQHSVDVPGMQEIVCLAFLAVRQSAPDVFCSEFEGKTRMLSSLGRD